MVGLLKIFLQLSPDRASQTAFQLTLDFRGTRRATSNPATAGDKFNATPSDAWSDLPTLPWTCTLHKSGTFVRTRSNTPPALCVGPLISYFQHEHVIYLKCSMLYKNGIVSISSTNLWELLFKLQINFRIDGREPKMIQINSEAWILIKVQYFVHQWISLDKLYKQIESLSNLVIIFELLAKKWNYIQNDSEASILIKILHFFLII